VKLHVECFNVAKNDDIFSSNVKEAKYLSYLFYLVFTVYIIVLGIIAGDALMSILVLTDVLVYALLKYVVIVGAVLFLLLILRWVLVEYAAVVGRLIIVLKNIVLIDFLMILVSIVFVVSFNLLNVLCPCNSLLTLCSSIRGLTDAEIRLLHCGFMCIVVSINTCVAFLRLHFSRIKRVFRSAIIVRKVTKAIRALAILIIIFSLLLYPIVSFKYLQVITELRKSSVIKCDGLRSSIECLWGFVKYYDSLFIFTYRRPCPKPRQLLITMFSLISNRDFIAELVVVSRTGACLDFALGATKLIEDLYGYRVRVVHLIGQDHVIPEVEVNGTWYVIDITYTTKNYPVKASEYADHLRRNYPGIYSNLEGLVDFDTGQDSSKEHGFYS